MTNVRGISDNHHLYAGVGSAFRRCSPFEHARGEIDDFYSQVRTIVK